VILPQTAVVILALSIRDTALSVLFLSQNLLTRRLRRTRHSSESPS
jgi:hypothetical protein